ncbi:Putative redox-active protein (C_GCAxxG_C_C) [Sphaerochaeta associata]|uniref:C-GCAxxG-C-C family protein n=1 Tax=Sphaerochaeta associata TaxID=1129264 RepID=A0ABY4DDC4_9SPIR|nr:C-GCAxxG-C-C family (seleno)protein [Sphaerochaeta associata]UOM52248.1 C-GCAxxG-C-C family protein [Sphaerochaeta associata]SMP46002.1 Putative redox-active protein (C_GCAxxG_C_C) [Sphaerochaeta associata]
MQSIEEHVHHLYWDLDINCARTTLMYLAQYFKIPLNDQTLQAAIGMHGGGGFGAQCGLVEGSLMFLAIYCASMGLSDALISKLCFSYAQAFISTFSSLECSVLRPGGFQRSDPPHLCEGLTVRAIAFTRDFIEDFSHATKPVD